MTVLDSFFELMGCMPSRDRAENADSGAVYTALRHVRQSFSWDCGLACVMMVLQQKGMTCTLVSPCTEPFHVRPEARLLRVCARRRT